MTVSDLLAPITARSWTTSCFVKSVHTDVFNHGPAKIVHADRLAAAGASVDGLLGDLRAWAASRTDLPGFVVLQSGPRGPRGGSALWASGFLPTTSPGRAVPRPRRPDPQPQAVRQVSMDRDAQQAFTEAVVRHLNNAAAARRSATPRSKPASRPTRWPTGCSQSAPELMDIGSEPKRGAGDVRRRAGQGLVRQQRPAGPPAGGARRAVHPAVPHQAGTSTAAPNSRSTEELPLRCQQVDRASAALVQGPQAARACSTTHW